MQALMMSSRNHMFVIIKKGENVNVCIHDFDDVKEESNKAASNDKHFLLRIIEATRSNKWYQSRILV